MKPIIPITTKEIFESFSPEEKDSICQEYAKTLMESVKQFSLATGLGVVANIDYKPTSVQGDDYVVQVSGAIEFFSISNRMAKILQMRKEGKTVDNKPLH